MPTPSLVISSGGGTHLYWMLAQPTKDIQRAERIIKGLSIWLDADSSMSGDQVLRIPMSVNTKPQRNQKRCQILRITPHEYHLDEFFGYELLTQTRHQPSSPILARPTTRVNTIYSRGTALNTTLSQVILDHLITHYGASRHPRNNGWHACYCPFPHRHDRFPGHHAYYNPDLGLFNCFGKHGQLLNWELAQSLHIDVNSYGGIYN